MDNLNDGEQALKQSFDDETSPSAQIDALAKQQALGEADIQADDERLKLDPEVQKKNHEAVYKQMESQDKSLAVNLGGMEMSKNMESSVINLAKGAGKGILKFGEDLVDTTVDIANWMSVQSSKKPITTGPRNKWVGWDMANAPMEEKVGMLIGRYAAPLATMGPLGVQGVAAQSIGAATVSAMTMDPEDKNLADVLDSFPALQGHVPEFLLSSPDDSTAAKRLKNGIAALVGDVVTLGTAKTMKYGAKGTSAAVDGVSGFFKSYQTRNAIKELQKAAATVIPDLPKGAGELAAAPKVKPADTMAKAEITPKQQKMLDKVGAEFDKVQVPTPIQFEKAKMSENAQQFWTDVGLDKQPEFAGAFDEVKRGVMSLEEVTTRAEGIANNPKEMDRLFNRAPGTPVNAEELLAMLSHTQREFEATTKLIPASGVFTDEADKILYMNQFAKYSAVAKPTFAGVSEQARGMRFFQESVKAAKGPANKIKLMEKFLEISGGNADEMAYFMKQAEKAGVSANNISASLAKKGITHKAPEIFWEHTFNAMFGITSNVKNIGGNSVLFVGKPLETLIASGLSKKEGVYAREAYAMVHGYVESIGEASSTAWNAFWKEKRPAGMETKWSGFRERATKMGRGEAWSQADGSVANIVNSYGYIMAAPSRALDANDMFFGIMANRASRRQQAMRATLDMGHKPGTAQFDEFYNRMSNSNSDEMSIIANKFQEEQTMKTPLTHIVGTPEGDKEVSGVLLGEMYSGIDKAFKNAPAGRLFVPFVRIGANEVDAIVQHIPGLNFLTPAWQNAMASGDPALKALARSKMAMGSAIFLSSGWLASHGMIAGNGIRDYKLEKTLGIQQDKNTLYLPFGKKIGLDRLGYMGAMLGMTADFAELITYMGDESADAANDLAAGMASIAADRLTPNYMAQNAGQFFKDIEDLSKGKVSDDDISAFIGKTIAGMAPLKGVARDLGKMFPGDDTKRDYAVDKNVSAIQKAWDGMKHEWMKSYPHIFGDDPRKEFPKQMNIFAEDIKLPHGANPDASSPFFTNGADDDPVRTELTRLGQHAPLYNPSHEEGESWLKVDMPERVVEKVILGQSQIVDLSPKQYEKLVKYSAGVGLGGPTLKEAMEVMVRKFEEQKIPDEKRRMHVKDLISMYRKRGKEAFMRDDTDIQQKLADKMVDRAYGVNPELAGVQSKETAKGKIRSKLGSSNVDPSFFEVGQ